MGVMLMYLYDGGIAFCRVMLMYPGHLPARGVGGHGGIVPR